MDVRHFQNVFNDIRNSKNAKFLELYTPLYFNTYLSAFFVLSEIQKRIKAQETIEAMDNNDCVLNIAIRGIEVKTNFKNLFDSYIVQPDAIHYALSIEVSDLDGNLCHADNLFSRNIPIFEPISFSTIDSLGSGQKYSRLLTKRTATRLKKLLQLTILDLYGLAENRISAKGLPQPSLKLYQPGDQVYLKGEGSLVSGRRIIVERVLNHWPETYWVWNDSFEGAYAKIPACALFRKEELVEDVDAFHPTPSYVSITEEMKEELDGFKQFLEQQLQK